MELVSPRRAAARLLALALLLAGCAAERPPLIVPGRPAAGPLIDQLLPQAVHDRAGWSADIRASFAAERLVPSRESLCAVIAIIEQESGFQVDPVVPNLGTIAWKEIERRARADDIPLVLVHAALALDSSDGRTYAQRIRAARTEKELSDTYEDFIGQAPLGRRLFAGWNPIRTRGPMQVNVAFAERYAARRPYPFPLPRSLDDELFTRRGSLYFGIAHLLDYRAPYDRYLYRFADYNSGQYASRNAAFQRALHLASGITVDPDGALLPEGDTTANAGSTERAALALARRLALTPREVHAALELGREEDFERSALYRRVFALAERRAGEPLPRAAVPHIELAGPKLTRRLTTAWYARRVEARFERCTAR